MDLKHTVSERKSPPKRLLLASFTAPPNQDGVAMAVGKMAEEMTARNWEVFIATHPPDTPNTGETQPHSYVLPQGFVKVRTPEDQKILDDLYAWLDRLAPSVIVIHSWVGWPIHALMPYAKTRGTPIFLMGHGFGDHLMQWAPKPPLFGLGRWFRAWLSIVKMPFWIKQMASLVVLGKRPHYTRAFDHWLAKRSGLKNVHVIPNSVSPLQPSTLDFRGKYQLHGKLVYLCVAGYSTTKDQFFVLESFLRANVQGATLVFIGSALNDYAEELKRRASQHRSEVLVLHGLPRPEVEAAIKECDVAVLGSRSEMQPIFLLEAMSEGKPWICPLVGAVDELQGGIIPARTPEGIAAAMQQMASPEHRAKLGALGMAQLKSDFSPEVVYNQWDQLLCRAITH